MSEQPVHPAVAVAAQALAVWANRRAAGQAGDVWLPYQSSDWWLEAQAVVPDLLRWAADHLDGQPLLCEAHDVAVCQVCPIGSDLLRAAAGEIEAAP